MRSSFVFFASLMLPVVLFGESARGQNPTQTVTRVLAELAIETKSDDISPAAYHAAKLRRCSMSPA